MRIQTIAGSAVLALGMLSATGVMAQSAASGSWEATTCAQFNQMDQSAKADIVNQISQAIPGTSLTSNSGLSSNVDQKTGNTAASMASNNAATDAGANPGAQPLTADQLASACQASPNVTLHDAVSTPGFINGGSNASK